MMTDEKTKMSNEEKKALGVLNRAYKDIREQMQKLADKYYVREKKSRERTAFHCDKCGKNLMDERFVTRGIYRNMRAYSDVLFAEDFKVFCSPCWNEKVTKQ